VRRWKLSPMDLESLDKWEAYTAAKEAMFERTDKKYAPWLSIKSNDKKRGRVNALRAYLNQFEYAGRDDSVVYPADELVVRRAKMAEGD
jgi:polyphosphate kinase